MLTPTIEKANETAVSTAVEQIQIKVLDPLMESNNKLKETIETQKSTIVEQEAQMDDLSRLLEEKTKSILALDRDLPNISLFLVLKQVPLLLQSLVS